MKRFPLVVVITIALILVGGIFLASRKTPSQPLPSNYEYFWGDGCPHCENVAKFFETWEGTGKVDINKMEVWNNAAKASLMRERAQYCKMSPKGMGVPFLFTPDGKCLTGDVPIIDYFKSLEL